MIIHREFENCGMPFIESKSDQNVVITCDGEYFDVAWDPIDEVREYIETDIPIGTPIPDENQEYAEAGKILMGVTE